VRRSREEIMRLLADYAGSGMSHKQWCDQNGVGNATLGYWLRREEQPRALSLVPIEVRDAERSDVSEAPGPEGHLCAIQVEPKGCVGLESAGAVATVPTNRNPMPGLLGDDLSPPALVVECGGCRVAFLQVGDVVLAARLMRALDGEARR